MSEIVIIGGTKGTGLELARTYLSRGANVLIAGRDDSGARAAAAELNRIGHPGKARSLRVDLSAPEGLEAALASIDSVKHLVLAGVARDHNSLGNYDVAGAIALATTKVVGYAATTAILKDRFEPGASVLMFGGLAKDRPYPGSTTVSTVNAALLGLAATMSLELRPTRINTIHPGLISNSPFWATTPEIVDYARKNTLTGVLPTMADIVDGCLFLLENPAANGVHLSLDGGKA